MAANPARRLLADLGAGAVYAFGAAAEHGGATGQGGDIAAIAAHPTNGGYWLLASV